MAVNQDTQDRLIVRIRSMISFGKLPSEIIESLKGEHDVSYIFLAYHAAKLLDEWASE